MSALKQAVRQHPMASTVVVVLVFLFVIVPLLGFILYAMFAGSGSVTY